MAWWIVAGRVLSAGKKAFRARFTPSVRLARKASRLKVEVVAGFARFVPAGMRGVCMKSDRTAQEPFSNFGIAFADSFTNLSSSILSPWEKLERRIDTKSTGESWQPQRSG